jgi:Excalibur calcium-binding domain
MRPSKFSLVCILAIFSTVLCIAPSNAAVSVYKNCTAMNKVYPGGVARSGAVNIGGSTKNQPIFDNSIYLSNRKLDRDKDGIACEK